MNFNQNKSREQFPKAAIFVIFALLRVAGCEPFPSIVLDENTATDSDSESDSDSDCAKPLESVCLHGDVYQIDDCGETADLIQDCEFQRERCVDDAAGASCACLEMWTGDHCQDCVRYVAADSLNTEGTGESWGDAFSSVQAAIAAASAFIDEEYPVERCEIWVKKGTYSAWKISSEDSIQLASGVDLIGGFAGWESQKEERDWETNETVLTGHDTSLQLGNVCHVVTGSNGAVIDGFTITGGRADCNNENGQYGGGILLTTGSLAVKNSRLVDNFASSGGGAIHHLEDTELDISDSTIEQNFAQAGGGIANTDGILTAQNVVFRGNAVDVAGSDLATRGRHETSLTQCRFIGRTTASVDSISTGNQPSRFVMDSCLFEDIQLLGGFGVVAFLIPGDVLIQNTVFNRIHPDEDSEEATYDLIKIMGPALPDSYPRVINSTFINGHPEKDAVIYVQQGAVDMRNSIFWGNQQSDFVIDEVYGGTVLAAYSNLTDLGVVESVIETNISEDPQFVDAANGDFRLKGTSPCLDAGSSEGAPASDFDQNPRFDVPGVSSPSDPSSFVDMGAFEYQGI